MYTATRGGFNRPRDRARQTKRTREGDKERARVKTVICKNAEISLKKIYGCTLYMCNKNWPQTSGAQKE